MTRLQSVQARLEGNFVLSPDVLQPDRRLADLSIDSLAVVKVLFAVAGIGAISPLGKTSPSGKQTSSRCGYRRSDSGAGRAAKR
jgi:hypothetical protein